MTYQIKNNVARKKTEYGLKETYKKTLLASSIALVVSSMAHGQITDDKVGESTSAGDIEEVIVTGIRGSQQTAIDIKRTSNSIVDGIAAEDIGKLPDVTIVDSLQRITGVQIQRSGGEGSLANVRGLKQVSTLLNGERYLTARNLAGAQPDLTDVPSQLMSGVDVYKSQNLRNATSGITGTIDLKTFRPSDFDEGFSTSFAIEAGRGIDTGEVDPAANGLVNWRNERFGVMLAIAKSESTLMNNSNGWTAGGPNGIDNQWNGASPELPSNQHKISGHGFDMIRQETLRDREAVNLSLETDLGEGFTLITEAFHTKMTELNRSVGLNISNRWSNPGNMRSDIYNDTGVPFEDGNDTWVNTEQYELDALWVNSFGRGTTLKSRARNYNIQLNYDNGGPLTMQGRFTRAFGELDATGGQTQADLSNWAGTQNVRHATFYPEEIAELFPESRYRDELGVGVDGGRFIDHNPLGYGEDPVLTVNTSGNRLHWGGPGLENEISGGLGPGNTLADYMSNLDSYAVTNTTSENNALVKAWLDTSSLKGKYAFDEPLAGFITSVEMGVRNEATYVDVDSYHIFAPVYSGNDNVSETPCSVQWRATDVQLNDNSGLNCSAGELIILPDGTAVGDNPGYPEGNENTGDVQTGIVVGDADNAGEVYGSTVLQEGDVWAAYRPAPPRGIEAINNPIWVTDFGGGATGLPGFWAADPADFDDPLGFHRRTFGDVDIVPVPGNSFDIDIETFSYDISTNFEIDRFSGNLGVRVIETELTVKANLTDSRSLPYTNTNPDIGDEISRNTYTDVLPVLNTQFELTDEILFRFSASETMMPLDLQNYGGGLSISTASCPEFGDIRCVTSANAGGNPNLKPWRATNLDVSAEYYFGLASAFSVGLYSIDIESFVTTETTPTGRFPDGDGIIRRTVNVTAPTQGEGGRVEGIELAAKLAMSDITDATFITNLGVDTNFTHSPSESKDINASGKKTPFPNNSKNLFNFALWYQDDKLQARLAYNFRDDRFEGLTLGNLERYQAATHYIDANITYNITDDMSIYLNGSNLAGEDEIFYIDFTNGSDKQFRTRNENEARYSLGFRAKF